MRNYICLFFLLLFLACKNISQPQVDIMPERDSLLPIPGAYHISTYLPFIKGKYVALVVNHTSLINKTHLVDTLKKLNINIVKIFAPEHGFRGDEERGVNYGNSIDPKTGIPVISLIGKKKEPSEEDLKNIDVVIYDIQDVGVRFFTYISTMYYVMQACAKYGKPLIILDRPNPNGDYVDGPVLKLKYKSFVGILPIPIVYGMTPGELAQMINGEYWLEDSLQCDLTVIKIKNYTHKTKYILPVKPSPNLPNYLSIRLYPSLCFFEATDISIGRGTYFPFQVIGYPNPNFGNFKFVPQDIPRMQTNPIHEGDTCFGIDLRNLNPDTIKFSLHYVLKFYRLCQQNNITFFTRPYWMDLLSGTDELRKAIISGKTEKQIRDLWKNDLENFKQKRKKYLLYP